MNSTRAASDSGSGGVAGFAGAAAGFAAAGFAAAGVAGLAAAAGAVGFGSADSAGFGAGVDGADAGAADFSGAAVAGALGPRVDSAQVRLPAEPRRAERERPAVRFALAPWECRSFPQVSPVPRMRRHLPRKGPPVRDRPSRLCHGRRGGCRRGNSHGLRRHG